VTAAEGCENEVNSVSKGSYSLRKNVKPEKDAFQITGGYIAC